MITLPRSRSCRRLRILGLLVLVMSAACMLPSAASAAGARAWSAAAQTDRYDGTTGSGGDIDAISCPAATQCTAMDRSGNEVTYNPTLNTVPAPVNVTKGSNGIEGLSCPSLTQCTAVTQLGSEVTFNPSDPGDAQTIVINTAGLYGLACVSTTVCVTASNHTLYLFNPSQVGATTSYTVSGSNNITQISCTSATSCTTIDIGGNAATFNPSSPGNVAAANVLSGGADAISCWANSCVAVGSGEEAYFTAGYPGLASSYAINLPYPDAVSCESTGASTSSCVAVNATGQELQFTPSGPGSPSPATVDGAISLTGISCSYSTAVTCSAVDSAGGGLVFSPTSPSGVKRTVIDADPSTDAISCPAENQCTELDTSGVEVTYDPTASPIVAITRATVDPGPGAQISCPTTTQCSTYDADGYEATFNPQAPGTVSDDQIDTGAIYSMGISCPSATQCTADDEGGSITFNPQAPGTPQVDTNLAGGNGIACPSATQCTVIEENGVEATFNPQQGASVKPTTATVDVNKGDQAIACPSTGQCTAVDLSGNEVTFSPTAPGAPNPQMIDTVSTLVWDANPAGVNVTAQAGELVSISCATVADCVAVDFEGQYLEGDPQILATWTAGMPAGAAGLSAVACAGLSICTLIDDSGSTSVGRLAPASTAAPQISGAAVSGATLTESHGSWSSPPDTYGYKWFDCDANGQNCTAIAGASAQTYTLTPSDIDHTIVVQELATNAGGTSGASSIATGIVTAPASTGPVTTTRPPGTTTKKPTRTQILTELRAVLAELKGANAKLATVVKRKGFVYTVKAPEAGKLTLEWTIKVRKRTEILAAVTYRFTKAKTVKVTIKLTKAGLKLLENKKLKRERVTEKATFAGVTSTRAVTLKR